MKRSRDPQCIEHTLNEQFVIVFCFLFESISVNSQDDIMHSFGSDRVYSVGHSLVSFRNLYLKDTIMKLY